MRILSIVAVVCLLFVSPAQAFLYEIKMHSITEISEMTDDQIMEAYLDAKVEERASAEFHTGAGFSNAKEYQLRKDLLRYIIHLRKEMQKREIDADPINDWLK